MTIIQTVFILHLFSIGIRGDNLWFVIDQVINNVVFPGDVIVALKRLEGIHIVVQRPLRFLRLLCLLDDLWSRAAAVLLSNTC